MPWNDAEAVRRAFAEHQLAAVLVEPYPANMGLIPPAAGFLELLRDLCTGYDTLLVFDEVITGFRVAPGGAQELTGVLPDLTVMGKILGGGLPAAAFGGSVALMERIAPAGDVYQAGTLSGNPLAVAAGRAALALLDEQAYLDLNDTTHALAEGLREAAGDRPVSVTSTTGLVTVFFAAEPPTDYAGAAACDGELYGAWCRALLARGVYPPASQFEAWFPSTAHTSDHIARTVEAAAAAFAEVVVNALARLAEALRDEGGLLAETVRDDDGPQPHGDAVAERGDTYPLLVEAIREGYLQHYAAGRVVRPDDPDLALLAGDRLYALGLERLAALGDLEAVAELADVIALCAQAHAEGDPARADAVWEAGAAAVASGPAPDHQAAKRRWRGA